jgi:hypothetical protein
LPDGRTFSFIVEDGIGTVQYKGKDRATEDHVNLDGKVYKLGQSKVMGLDIESFISPEISTEEADILLTTQPFGEDQKSFCEMRYRPTHKATEGVNIVYIQHMRWVSYGKFTGNCHVEGELIPFTEAYGVFEVVHSYH